jgi:nicotinamidase-related amidase
MKALLIIDMQMESFKPETPRLDAENVVQRINSLSDVFRRNGDKVIFIQHDGTKEDYLFPGTHEWNILPSLVQCLDDIFVVKTANDAFYQTDLDSVLDKFGITEIYITGCATDFCVDAAVHSALNCDFDIAVVKDCHTRADRPQLNAEKVIEYHNWLWESMTPTKGRIRLVSSKDLVSVFDKSK